MTRSGAKNVSPGAMATFSTPASRRNGQSRSGHWAAATSTPSEARGAACLAPRARAKWPRNMGDRKVSRDGRDGQDGRDGRDGQDGQDGRDGPEMVRSADQERQPTRASADRRNRPARPARPDRPDRPGRPDSPDRPDPPRSGASEMQTAPPR